MPELTYDVCLSFAGEDRPYVEQVAAALRESGVRVFYDAYEEAELWGKNLYQHLDHVYRKQARYCIAFFSSAYARKLWTRHELVSAQARAFEENREYILPARFDDTEIPGVSSVMGYIDLRTKTPEALARLVVAKLGMSDGGPKSTADAIPPSQAVRQAETLISSPELSERQKGLIALRVMDSTDAADALARALSSPFRHVRIESALALARRGDKRASDSLVNYFADGLMLWVDLAPAMDGLRPEDRQVVLARAMDVAPRQVLTYLDRTNDIGTPMEAFSRGLFRFIDSPAPGERAAAIILARKFKVRDGALPHLIPALKDTRRFEGHLIESRYAPRVCDQAVITITELGLDGLLATAAAHLWKKRRRELSEYARTKAKWE